MIREQWTTMSQLRYLFLFAALSFVSTLISFSQEKFDVIYLKSGGKVIGTIIKKRENQSVVVQLQSGDTMTIQWSEIKNFDVFVARPKPIDSTLIVNKIEEAPNNAIYFEAGGPGLLYSINFERMITDDFSIRLGYSSWGFSLLASSSGSFTGIPIMINNLMGDGNSKFEFGAGIEFINASTTTSFFGLTPSTTNTVSTSAGIATLGYRYQPRGGGIHFRAVCNPIFGSGGVRVTFGLSLGSCF
jgi:hypothetical protein